MYYLKLYLLYDHSCRHYGELFFLIYSIYFYCTYKILILCSTSIGIHIYNNVNSILNCVFNDRVAIVFVLMLVWYVSGKGI